jgi:hypothetical protein
MDGQQSREPASGWTQPRDMAEAAIVCWNWMGGEIDWSGFEVIAGVLGVDDVETLIRAVVSLRGRMNA